MFGPSCQAEQRAMVDLSQLRLRIAEGKQAVIIEPLRRTGREFALSDAAAEVGFEEAAGIADAHQEGRMGQRASERYEISHQPRLYFLISACFFRCHRDALDGPSRFLTQNFLVDRRRNSSRLPVGGIDLVKISSEALDRRQLAANPAEIGAQHVIRDDRSEAVSHDDDAVVIATPVQVMERVDGAHSDGAAYRDIGGRAAEIARSIAEIWLQEGRVDDEIDPQDGKCQRGAPGRVQAPGPCRDQRFDETGCLRIPELVNANENGGHDQR